MTAPRRAAPDSIRSAAFGGTNTVSVRTTSPTSGAMIGHFIKCRILVRKFDPSAYCPRTTGSFRNAADVDVVRDACQ
jgi:hypothetical protein